MYSNNNQASLNNKANLAPIGSIRIPTSHWNSPTGESANNQNKPLTNIQTINTSHKEELSKEYKTANSVFKAPLPPKKLLYRKYVLEGMGRENIDKVLDLSRHKQATSTRQASPLQSLKILNTSPQKNKTPTDVTTTKIGNLSAPQQKWDIGAQTSTTHAQRPNVIVSPTHHSQKCAPAAQTSAPSFNQSSDYIDEQQRKRLKIKEMELEYLNMIRAHLDEFTVKENGIEFVTIGENGTIVLKEFLLELEWLNTGAAITRKLLCHFFDNKTLATLSAKLPLVPLDKSQPEERQLNRLIVEDIIDFMVLVRGLRDRDLRKIINNKCEVVAKKLLRSLSAKAFAPPEVNVKNNPDTNPEAASSDSSETDSSETDSDLSDFDTHEIVCI